MECLGKEQNGNAAVYLQLGCAHVSDALPNNGLPSAKEHQGFLKVWDGFYTMDRVGMFNLKRADVSRQGGTVFHPVKLSGVLLEGSKWSWFLSTVQN